MAETVEKIKTKFGWVGCGNIEKAIDELNWLKKEAESLVRKALFLLDNWNSESIDDLEYFLTDICSYFNDCTRCPINKICEFAVKGCVEAHECNTCPRLRICVRDRSSGLILGGDVK